MKNYLNLYSKLRSSGNRKLRLPVSIINIIAMKNVDRPILEKVTV